jgi:hypothetical protein
MIPSLDTVVAAARVERAVVLRQAEPKTCLIEDTRSSRSRGAGFRLPRVAWSFRLFAGHARRAAS